MLNILNFIKAARRKINSYRRWIWIGSLDKFSFKNKFYLSLIFFFSNIIFSKINRISFFFNKNLVDSFNNYEFMVLVKNSNTKYFMSKSFDIRINKLRNNSSLFWNLYNQGFYKLDNKYNLDKNLCNDFVSKCMNSRCYNSHISLESEVYDFPSDKYLYWSLKYQSWQKPYIQKILNNDIVSKILTDYFNDYNYFIYSINTLISLPSRNLNTSVINYHRDHDDIEFLTLFIYWTDTSKNNGSIRYIPQSQLHNLNLNDLKNQNFYLEASAGEMYFIDTFGLHSGNENLTNPRVVTWIRFSKNRITNSSFYDGELQNVNIYQNLLIN